MVSTGHSIPQENPLFDFPELGKLTYGMGQQMNTYRGHRIIEHIGTIPGQVSRVLRVPDLGVGLVIMTNEHGGVHDRLGFLFAMTASWRVLDHLLGLQPIDWERRSVFVNPADIFEANVIGRLASRNALESE